MYSTLTLALWSVSLLADPALLTLGNAAPPIKIEKYLKGDTVAKFEPGKVYVVEFWATWCGPCIANIPHLSQLQRRFPNVIVIGVSTDDDLESASRFVETNSEKMRYRVAFGGHSGAMSEAWVDASGQEGIPAAFVVNREGRIAWIGHPADLDRPLAAIVKGTWDLAAEKKKYDSRLAAERQLEQFYELADQLDSPEAAGKLLATVQKTREKLIEPIADIDDLALQLSIGIGDIAKTTSLVEELIKQAQQSPTNQLTAATQRLLAPLRELELPDEAVSPRAGESRPDLLKLAVRAGEANLEIAIDRNHPNEIVAAAERLSLAYERTGQRPAAINILTETIERLNDAQQAAKSATNELQSQLRRLQGSAEDGDSKPRPGGKKRAE